MNLNNKIMDITLKKLPVQYWNILNFALAYCSKPTIGSPVEFTGEHGLHLKEYLSFNNIPENLRRKFIDFCYPSDLEHRDEEIECDRINYWPHCSFFIVFDKDNNVVGTLLFIKRTKTNKLPVEYSFIVSDNKNKGERFNIEEDIGEKKSIELYRLRRSFDINIRVAIPLVTMLFKAVWTKCIQEKIDFMYLSCSNTNTELKNMYGNRLAFEDPGIKISYNRNDSWTLLRKDCCQHDKKFATESQKNFYLQLFVRANLKKKLLYKPQPLPALKGKCISIKNSVSIAMNSMRSRIREVNVCSYINYYKNIASIQLK